MLPRVPDILLAPGYPSITARDLFDLAAWVQRRIFPRHSPGDNSAAGDENGVSCRLHDVFAFWMGSDDAAIGEYRLAVDPTAIAAAERCNHVGDVRWLRETLVRRDCSALRQRWRLGQQPDDIRQWRHRLI